jgi:hypothetical protein
MISNCRSQEWSSPKSSSELLCSNLAQGMHAAAQPLTVLLAGLSPTLTNEMTVKQLRELTASSAMQVQRVCTLFSGLQELVIAESAQPRLSATPILPLLHQLADGINLLFQHDEITLSTTLPGTCPPVLIDGARTHQALSRVLLIAHAVSTARDTIELIVSSSADEVSVLVRNQNSSIAPLNPEATFGIAVAEANMRSQQAGFSWSLRPFAVLTVLHKAPVDS